MALLGEGREWKGGSDDVETEIEEGRRGGEEIRKQVQKEEDTKLREREAQQK